MSGCRYHVMYDVPGCCDKPAARLGLCQGHWVAVLAVLTADKRARMLPSPDQPAMF